MDDIPSFFQLLDGHFDMLNQRFVSAFAKKTNLSFFSIFVGNSGISAVSTMFPMPSVYPLQTGFLSIH